MADTIGCDNVAITTDKQGNIVITVDPKKRLGRSASGKTVTVASTRGAAKLPSGLMVNLNVYVKE